MADLNLNELNEEFDRVSKSLNGFNTGMVGASTNAGLLAQANKTAAAAVNKESKAREEYANQLKTSAKDIGSSIKGMASGLAQGQSGLQTMSTVVGATTKAVGGLLSAVPIFGTALNAAAKGIAEASKIVIDQLQVGWDAYKGLSDTGIVSSFKDLKELSDATGQRYEQINATLGKYSTTMAALSGTTLDGVNRFARLAKGTEQIRDDFYKLGISAQDFSEFQASYIAEQVRNGRIKGKTDADLIAGTKSYVEELDTIAKLTGTSRKAIQDKRNQAQADSRYAATLDSSTEPVKKLFQGVNDIIDAQAPTIAKGLRDSLGGVVNTPEARQFLLQAGVKGQEAVRRMRSGEISQEEAANLIREGIAEGLKNGGQQMAMIAGDANILGKDYTQRKALAESARNTKENSAAIVASRDAQDEQTQSVAKAINKTDKMGVEFQHLATGSKAAAKALEGLATTMESLTKMLNDRLGITPTQSTAPSAKQAAYMKASSASMTRGLTSGVTPLASNSGISKILETGAGYNIVQNANGQAEKRSGARNWRNNNPGNLEYGPFAQRMGAIGSDGRFAIFPTLEMGEKAKKALLFSENSAYVNMTIAGAMNKYAPASENNTGAYINAITSATGASSSTKLSSLSEDQRNKMMASITKHEGFKPGTVTAVNGTPQSSQGVTVASAPAAAAPVATQATSEKEVSGKVIAMVMNKLDDITSLLSKSLAVNQKIATHTS